MSYKICTKCNKKMYNLYIRDKKFVQIGYVCSICNDIFLINLTHFKPKVVQNVQNKQNKN